MPASMEGTWVKGYSCRRRRLHGAKTRLRMGRSVDRSHTRRSAHSLHRRALGPPLMTSDITLITGATGFVGRAVVNDSRNGHRKIRLLARRPVPTEADVVTIAPGKTTDDRLWDCAMADVRSVLHLAARAHVAGDADDARFTRINVELSCKVAEAAFSRGVRRFVFVSSIGAVAASNQLGQPLNELSRCSPSTAYGRSKLLAERKLQKLAALYNAELVVVRPPLVHGPGAPGNLATIAAAIQRGVPLPFGGIANQRSVIHVKNLSRFLLLCLESEAASGETFHVRDLQDYSTPQILAGVAKSVRRQLRMFTVPWPALRAAAELTNKSRALRQITGSLQVDDSKARRMLCFSPDPFPIEVAAQGTVHPRSTL